MTHAYDRLLRTPDRHLFAFEGDQAIFLPVDRMAYHRSIFLDDRIAVGAARAAAVPVDALAEVVRGATFPEPRWIFHMAQCGSTLLARALDVLDRSLVLREPLALRQLGVDAAGGGQACNDAWEARLRIAAALAARRFHPDAPAIVKANVPVNFMLPRLLSLTPGAPAIFLYLPLSAYLLAVLRGDGHRGWVERVTTELRPGIEAVAGSIEGASITVRAAALWLAQMRLYQDALDGHPRSCSLNAADLFASPAAVLRAAFSVMGVPMAEAAIKAIVAGDLFATHAKNPAMKFDTAARQFRETALARTLKQELDEARAWIERRLPSHPLSGRLIKPLIGAAPALLDDR